jgi:hypothetical protein
MGKADDREFARRVDETFCELMLEDRYVVVNPQAYRALRNEAEWHQKWMVDLFSPAGLRMIAPL